MKLQPHFLCVRQSVFLIFVRILAPLHKKFAMEMQSTNGQFLLPHGMSNQTVLTMIRKRKNICVFVTLARKNCSSFGSGCKSLELRWPAKPSVKSHRPVAADSSWCQQSQFSALGISKFHTFFNSESQSTAYPKCFHFYAWKLIGAWPVTCKTHLD